MYTKKFGLQFFGEDLSTKKEFHNCVDHCAVAVQKDSDDYLPSRSGSDSTCFLVKYLSIYIHTTRNLQDLTRQNNSRDENYNEF